MPWSPVTSNWWYSLFEDGWLITCGRVAARNDLHQQTCDTVLGCNLKTDSRGRQEEKWIDGIMREGKRKESDDLPESDRTSCHVQHGYNARKIKTTVMRSFESVRSARMCVMCECMYECVCWACEYVWVCVCECMYECVCRVSMYECVCVSVCMSVCGVLASCFLGTRLVCVTCANTGCGYNQSQCAPVSFGSRSCL